MRTKSYKIRALAVCIGLSILVHLLVLMSLGRFGDYTFGGPVNLQPAVMVDMAKLRDDAAPVEGSDREQPDDAAEEAPDERKHAEVQEEQIPALPAMPERDPAEQKIIKPAETAPEKLAAVTRASKPAAAQQPDTPRQSASAAEIPPPLRAAEEFMSSKSEKLSYLVSLMGVPVGNVELEAKNEHGEVRITLRTKSNSALSNIYPVDNLIETRHIGGNFIITKIRQREGSSKSDIGFTIFLRDKRVFWVDRTRNRYSDETIPNSEVLDTLSSFYYLRNRPLQIGTTEILHIYDGDIYAPVPVEILRQEEVRLRNFKKVDTLLLRHAKQKEGIFRRTGDMLVWLTNDENKVPVRIETTTPVGKVIVELVSAETQHYAPPGTQKQFPQVPYSVTSNVP